MASPGDHGCAPPSNSMIGVHRLSIMRGVSCHWWWVCRRTWQLSFTGSYLLQRGHLLRQAYQKHRLGRCLFWLLVDVLMGYAWATLILAHWAPSTQGVQLVLGAMDSVVLYLRRLITWLMDAPAGLKLNSVLSSALGKFFLYHIHLWVTFLHLATPLLSQALSRTMGVLSYLGLMLQISVAQDTFNLVTFHVHCFFTYARRLFLSQTHGLQSLWRLFRGKKYNPLRDRVDTSHHDVDQLFVGTLAFTILLFLYPTTLVYFAVFKVLDLAIVALHWLASGLVQLGLSFQ
ncbi:hypothetical protein TCAL_03064 [Tigriopus californicus]|uniref:Phosphatidylinositol N-acetylglucosaminyltransferase subunit Q n=1 Tax=Tigriopus californicus TaxID=6832 RepID=A0A553NTN7_TIGCA|nr:phosphatidylinositol N-acetylglucosaminyltransferase subunit Q-like [Tigriopus californicus]TRY68790.1 hypothetical protein TCAL_03064 [Tigriopus californicus]|eukprot:TCALIF_03064-PA protein Name:"Similar to Pigq Phosphatidylinositol N-acetylglucosaminyltransferase subunit Q (Mus musculus)" AED:0.14 eAED:0.14 QI:0/-1/0/1/-1/1/1/0/287